MQEDFIRPMAWLLAPTQTESYRQRIGPCVPSECPCRVDKPAELSFYLRPANRSSNKHVVWIPDQPTGTHFGAGHWAEVDENGRVIERNDLDVVVMGRDYARHLEMSRSRPML